MIDQICENVSRETVEQSVKKYWCIKCGTNPRRENQRWCKGCHASWKRKKYQDVISEKVEQKIQSITSSLEPMMK